MNVKVNHKYQKNIFSFLRNHHSYLSSLSFINISIVVNTKRCLFECAKTHYILIY